MLSKTLNVVTIESQNDIKAVETMEKQLFIN